MGLTRPRAHQLLDIDYKQSVRAVTVANVTLVGGAPSQVDGVSLNAGDRILVTGQSTGTENGLYQVITVGTGSNGTWTRTSDANQTGEIEAGMIVMVTEGTVYADTQWKLTTNDPITIGTSVLTFVINILSSVGGSNTQIQYNNAGTLGGSANLTWDGSQLYVGGAANVGGNILPAANVTYDLGSSTQRWNDIWLSNSTIYLGEANLSATGNVLVINGSNVVTSTGGASTFTGNVTADYFIGNGSQLTGISTSTNRIFSGTSNVDIATANADITVSVAGTSNVAVFSSSGLSVTGNVDAANLSLSAGNITVQNPTQTPLWMTNESDYISLNSDSYVQLYWTSNIANLDPALGNDGYQWIYIDAQGAHVRTTVGGANIRDWDWNASSGQITSNFDISTTGNVTGGNLDTVGYVNAVGNVSADENIIGGNIITTGLITATGNITGGNLSVGTGTISMGNIVNTNANGVGNIGTSTGYFNTVFAKATSAQYADVAEKYVADRFYPPGTVLEIGGSAEVQATSTYASVRIAGVVSTSPALLMNSTESDANSVELALLGRVPCRVTGDVHRGDLLTSSDRPGVATTLDPKDYRPGSVIGKALESHSGSGERLIEVLVGRL